MKYTDVVGIEVSDIHLSHKPPKFREAEPNWYAAMMRPLEEVRALVEDYRVPLVYAGDIFDDGWRVAKVPPELINFAIKYLPTGYGIPGQHDLPHHRYEDIEKSAYWTLVQAGVIKDLPPNEVVGAEELMLFGFPWGTPVVPCPDAEVRTFVLKLAVVHQYMWVTGSSYVGASDDSHVGKFTDRLKGYDAVVVGDNHKGWQSLNVFNCGAFMVRKSDERNYKPSVGLLHRDGTTTRHFLDTSKDRYAEESEPEKAGPSPLDIGKFVEGLTTLSKGAFDFPDAVAGRLKTHPVRPTVQDIILQSMRPKK